MSVRFLPGETVEEKIRNKLAVIRSNAEFLQMCRFEVSKEARKQVNDAIRDTIQSVDEIVEILKSRGLKK